jgi:Methyltransferase domain
MAVTEQDLRDLSQSAGDRLELWTKFVDAAGVSTVAEVGVYRGAYAARLLADCPGLKRYFLIDPWRHLDDWNKPANKADDVFEGYLQETLDKTKEHADKRVVLRGKTVEVIDRIGDQELDFAYVDGDHTLRGITIDLQNVWPKIRPGGWLAGDDFCRSIWQHSPDYEPTLVFPYAVYFAEAVGARVFALPFNQFLIEKNPEGRYEFVDLTGRYGETGVLPQVAPRGARKQAPKQAGHQAGQQAAKKAPTAAPAAGGRSQGSVAESLRRLVRRK